MSDRQEKLFIFSFEFSQMTAANSIEEAFKNLQKKLDDIESNDQNLLFEMQHDFLISKNWLITAIQINEDK